MFIFFVSIDHRGDTINYGYIDFPHWDNKFQNLLHLISGVITCFKKAKWLGRNILFEIENKPNGI